MTTNVFTDGPSKDYLRKVVEDAARDLAREAVGALGFIAFRAKNNVKHVMQPDAAVDRLTPAYEAAFKLKKALLLSPKNTDYVAQFVSSGQQVNDAVMEIEEQVEEGNGNVVKICVFPIIRVLSPEPNNPDEAIGKPVISYQNLGLAKTHEDVDGELLQKGLVLA